MSSGSSGVGDTQYYNLDAPPTTGPLADQFQPGGVFYPLPSFPLLVVTQTLNADDVLVSGPNIPIIEYSQKINETIDALREQLYNSEAAESLASKKFYQMLLQRAITMRELSAQVYNALRLQKATMGKRGNETTGINADITAYNQTVSSPPPPNENSVISDLNQAIENYNNPASPDYQNPLVLQAAYDAYSAFAAAQNVNIQVLNAQIAAYNAQIAANNANIIIINETRATLGFPPFELQQPLPLRALMPDLPPFPPSPGTSIPLRSDQPLADILNNPPPDDTAYFDAFVTIYQNNLVFIQTFADTLRKNELDQEFFKSRNRGKPILARLGAEPVAPGEAQTPASAPSTGYAAIAAGLFKTLEIVLSQALWDTIMKSAAIPPTQRTLDELRATTLSLIQGASIQAAGPTVAFLAKSLPPVSLLPFVGIDEAAVNVVFSLSYANEIRNLINGEVLHETVLQSLKADPAFGNLTQDELSNLAGTFAAGVGVSLGLISLQQIGAALGTPGLGAQLLSLLPGVQALGSNVLSPPIFSELVNNGFTTSLVGALLVGAGLDRSTAAETIRSALANSGEGPDGYFSALTKALEEAGFDTTGARDLAFQTTLEVLGLLDQENVTNDQLSQSVLQSAVNEDAIRDALVANGEQDAAQIAKNVADDLEARRQIENSILQENIKDDFRFQDELNRSQLKSNLIADNVIRDQIVRDGLNDDVVRRDITLRDIRTSLIRTYINRGEDIQSAANKAFGAINALNSEQTQIALLDQNALKESLENIFINRGATESDAIANSNSLFDEIRRSPIQTIVNFRAFIRDLLVHDFDIDRTSAGRIIAGLNLGIGNATSLGLFNVGGPFLSQSSIGDALRDHVTGLVGSSLGGDRANLLASRINEDVISAHDSLINSIQKSMGILLDKKDENVNELLRGTVRSGIRPDRDLFAFVQQLLDPGNALIYSVWSGLMYSQSKPGDKKSIDAIV